MSQIDIDQEMTRLLGERNEAQVEVARLAKAVDGVQRYHRDWEDMVEDDEGGWIRLSELRAALKKGAP